MSKIKRYFEVLKRTKFGLALPVSGIFNYVKYFYKKREEVMVPSQLAPVAVTLFVTDRCNLRCPFCTRGQKKNGELVTWQEREMDAAFVEKVLNQEVIKRTMIAILSGGEPLLNKDIYNIIRVVKRYKKQCGLITNGLLLSDPLPDLIKAGLDDLQLSVYDHTWDKLQKILPKVCSKFRINASYVLLKSVMEKNPTHVENIVKFCKEAGCSSFKINICQPFDGNDSETIFDDCANYHEFGKKLKLENKNFNLFVPGAIPQILRKPQEKRCLMPWQQILVNGTGEISMCCNTTFLSKPFGNILDDNDNKSYNSPILCEIRRNLLNDNLEVHEFCKKCLHLAGQSYSARL